MSNKIRRILVTYVKNDLKSLSNAERITAELTNDLMSKGKKIKMATRNEAVFEGGTKITKIDFGADIRGKRFTHIYIEESALKLSNANSYINNALIPSVISENYNYKALDTEGKVENRVMVFNKEIITEYHKKYHN